MSGALGSMVGSPADLINVRMQSDAKLPIGIIKNYLKIWKINEEVIEMFLMVDSKL